MFPAQDIPLFRQRRGESSAARGQRVELNWWALADRVFHRWAAEQVEFLVRLRRRQWNRLGFLLQKHTWCQKFRKKYFTPVWEAAVVKKWKRLQ